MDNAEAGVMLLCGMLFIPFALGVALGVNRGMIAARHGWTVAIVPEFVLRLVEKFKSFLREVTE